MLEYKIMPSAEYNANYGLPNKNDLDMKDIIILRYFKSLDIEEQRKWSQGYTDPADQFKLRRIIQPDITPFKDESINSYLKRIPTVGTPSSSRRIYLNLPILRDMVIDQTSRLFGPVDDRNLSFMSRFYKVIGRKLTTRLF